MLKSVSNITFINDGLMWQDTNVNVEQKLNRLELKVYCRKLDFANRKDWRVPVLSEMISLVDYNKITPASLDKIKYIIPLPYWTSSPSVLEKRKNWFVDFDLDKNHEDMQSMLCLYWQKTQHYTHLVYFHNWLKHFQ